MVPNVSWPNWFSFSWVLTGDGSLRIELYIDAGDAPTNKGYLRALLARRQEFEQAAGFPLEWDPMEGRRAARVSVARPLGPNPPDEDPELLAWAVRALLGLNDAFRVAIRTLTPLQNPDPGDG